MIILDRWYRPNCTLSQISVDGFNCLGLELPWCANQQQRSCIPEGEYEYFIRMSPSRKSNVLQLKDVPNRTFIQVHAGNFTSQIKGCILVGDGIKYLNRDNIPDVTNSKNTLDSVLVHAGDSGKIVIRG